MAVSIGVAALLVPIGVVRVGPVPTARTELRTSTILVTETWILRTTTQTQSGFGLFPQIIVVTIAVTTTRIAALQSQWTTIESFTTTVTTREQAPILATMIDQHSPLFLILDVLAKVVSVATGTAGIVSFIMRRRQKELESARLHKVTPTPVPLPAHIEPAPVTQKTPEAPPMAKPTVGYTPKFCLQCGKPLRAGSKFCLECGAPTRRET